MALCTPSAVRHGRRPVPASSCWRRSRALRSSGGGGGRRMPPLLPVRLSEALLHEPEDRVPSRRLPGQARSVLPLLPVVRQALSDALTLVLPIDCAGCDDGDTPLCDECRRLLAPRTRRRDVDGVPVWSGLEFDGAPARVIRSLKQEGR